MTASSGYIAAFIMGLMSSGHCIGMCGGIVCALAFATPHRQAPYQERLRLLIAYNSGRVLTYTLAGVMIAGIGVWLTDRITEAYLPLRYLSAMMLILMGCYLFGLRGGMKPLEAVGARLWRIIQPLGKPLWPVNNPTRALLLGMVWGWLPCGLVYGMLIWALSVQDTVEGALIMFFFGMGTLPALLATGMAAERFRFVLQHPRFRLLSASLVIGFGVWTLPVWHTLARHH